MKRKNFGTYYGIRKVSWDQLWHALFRTDDGRESWDRVTKQEALKIAKKVVIILGSHNKASTIKNPWSTMERSQMIDATLTEEELDQDVQWATEGRSGKTVDLWITSEDMINPSGDGCEPVSVYEGEPDFDVEAETVIYKKGTVILLID